MDAPLHQPFDVADPRTDYALCTQLAADTKSDLTQRPIPRMTLDVPIADEEITSWQRELAGLADGDVPLFSQAPTLVQQAPVPPLDLSAVKQLPMSALLAHKRKWLTRRQAMPVFSERHRLLAAIRRSQLMTLVGETGVGKTTQLPQVLMETELLKNKRLVVVEPTPVLALLVAQVLKEQCGAVGVDVAVALPYRHEASSGTRLVVTTYRMLLSMLRFDPFLRDIGCLLLDEAQERSIDHDLALTLLRETIVKMGVLPFKVVLCCNSLEAEALLYEYFRQLEGPSFAIARENVEKGGLDQQAQAPATLYLEDAVVWTLQPEPSMLSDDDVQSLQSERHIEGLTQVQQLEEVAFAPSEAWAKAWGALIVKCAMQYNAAALKTCTMPSLPTVAVVLPSYGFARCVLECFRASPAANLALFVVHERHTFTSERAKQIAERLFESPTQSSPRQLVLLMDPTTYQCLSVPNVGCLIDCAREHWAVYDNQSQVTSTDIDFVSKATLRSRRLRLSAASGCNIAIHLLPKATALKKTRMDDPHPLQRCCTLEQFCDACLYLHVALGPSVNVARLIGTRLFGFGSGLNADVLPRSDVVARMVASAEELLQLTTGARLAETGGKLTAMDVTLSSMGLPLQVSKLLLFGGLLGREQQATLIASCWLTGGFFPAADSSYAAAKLRQEVLSFFAQEDGCDSAAVLRAVEMWHDTRQKNEEENFFAETGASKAAMEEVLAVQADLLDILERTGWAKHVSGSNLPQTASYDILTKLAVECAMHPNVAVPVNDTLLLPKQHTLTQGQHSIPKGMSATVHASSVVSGRIPAKSVVFFADSLSCAQCRPPTALVFNACVGTPLGLALASQHCAVVGNVAASSRCRGWYSPISTAWRTTKLAQKLPPIPQLAPKLTPLQRFCPLDSCARDICTADRLVAFSITAKSCKFLMELKEKLNRRIHWALMAGEKAASTSSPVRLDTALHSPSLANAAEWILQREANGREWLHQRRTGQSSNTTKALSAVPDASTYWLHPPFQYTSCIEPPASFVSPASSEAAPASSTAAAPLLESYHGEMPNAMEQAMIETTVKVVAAAASRENESEMLRQHPEEFSFLSPSHRLYGYYSWRLRQVAPNLAWLGDDIPKLVEFLQQLELEVVSEIEAEAAQSAANNEQQPMAIEEAQPTADAGRPMGITIVREVEPDAVPATVFELPGGESAENVDVGPAPAAPIAPPAADTPTAPEELEAQYLMLEALVQPAVYVDPLSIPPPPIPIDPNAPRNPSVLVSPLPQCPEGQNLPLIMAKALGETMTTRVGPTLIVGEVARIDVPNSKVEQRAIDMGAFICLGQRLTISRNDRIVDNPAIHYGSERKIDFIKKKLREDNPRHLQRVEYSPDRAPASDDAFYSRPPRGRGAFRGRGQRGGGPPVAAPAAPPAAPANHADSSDTSSISSSSSDSD